MRRFLNFFLYVLYPLVFFPLLFVLRLFSKKLRDRRKFENKNKKEKECRSFKKDGEMADVCFEVSSEGELEQVLPLIESLLEKKKRVELTFCSESVEKKCLSLASENHEYLRVFRFPLATYCPFGLGQSFKRWASAPVLVLCRYDFFPELLSYGIRPQVEFVLVSATLKGKEDVMQATSSLKHKLLRSLYHSFDHVITATGRDRKRFEEILGIDHIRTYDFRLLQIQKRYLRREETVRRKLPRSFFNYMDRFAKGQRILFGSYWPIEAGAFADTEFIDDVHKRKVLPVIVPHHLNQDNLLKISEELGNSIGGRLGILLITEDMSEQEKDQAFFSLEEEAKIIVLGIKGVLCELYSFFGHSYVGGGHGRSIHSVLEPFLNFSRVYCGPKTYRSTEFDLISEVSEDEVHRINELSEFYPTFLDKGRLTLDIKKRENWMKSQEGFLEEFLRSLV